MAAALLAMASSSIILLGPWQHESLEGLYRPRVALFAVQPVSTAHGAGRVRRPAARCPTARGCSDHAVPPAWHPLTRRRRDRSLGVPRNRGAESACECTSSMFTRPDPGDRRPYARPHRRSGAAGRGARVCRAVGHRTRSAAAAPTLDPVVLMSVIAAVTNRIEIGTCVLQVPVRHPVELAHRIPVIARDDRRPAPARSRLRLDAGRFRSRRSRLYTTLQGADAGARHDAAGLARRDARRTAR